MDQDQDANGGSERKRGRLDLSSTYAVLETIVIKRATKVVNMTN